MLRCSDAHPNRTQMREVYTLTHKHTHTPRDHGEYPYELWKANRSHRVGGNGLCRPWHLVSWDEERLGSSLEDPSVLAIHQPTKLGRMVRSLMPNFVATFLHHPPLWLGRKPPLRFVAGDIGGGWRTSCQKMTCQKTTRDDQQGCNAQTLLITLSTLESGLARKRWDCSPASLKNREECPSENAVS